MLALPLLASLPGFTEFMKRSTSYIPVMPDRLILVMSSIFISTPPELPPLEIRDSPAGVQEFSQNPEAILLAKSTVAKIAISPGGHLPS